MTDHAVADDLDLALRLADRADAITRAAFHKADLQVETKADRTPVSEADKAVEAALREELAVTRSGDRIVGEEYGDSGSGPRRWIIDPIDGTKNFVRRVPVWATLLALEVDGVLTVGVVSAPALGRRWWAGRGLGAWVSEPDAAAPRRLGTSKVATLDDAHLTGAALSSWKDPGRFVDLAVRTYHDRSFGDFWSHMLVAEGVCDIGIDPIATLWDLAPLQVIVEEAGGRFTDLDGVPRADGGSGISSNGLLHDEALKILAG